jgi:hypothetical protein
MRMTDEEFFEATTSLLAEVVDRLNPEKVQDRDPLTVLVNRIVRAATAQAIYEQLAGSDPESVRTEIKV